MSRHGRQPRTTSTTPQPRHTLRRTMISFAAGVALVFAVHRLATRGARSARHLPATPAPDTGVTSRPVVSPPARTSRSTRRYLAGVVAGVMVGVATISLLPTTLAILADQIAFATISVTGGSVNPPSNLNVVRVGDAARVTWSAPGGGLAPSSYELERRLVPAGFTGTPTTTGASTPHDDATVLACGQTYGWQARSTRVGLRSGWTAEQQLTLSDTAAPAVVRTRIFATSGPGNPVADFARPGGSAYVYAQVDESCPGATVTFAFPQFNMTYTATQGSFQPLVGGDTYNYRFGPLTIPAGSADGLTIVWTVAAIDGAGNVSGSVPGTSARVDDQAPASGLVPQAVATATNYFSPLPGVGRGEVRPNNPYVVYARFTEPALTGGGAGSGIATVTSDTSAVTSGAGATALAGGSYSTDEGTTAWNYATGPLTAGGLADSTQTFSVKAVDAVGNTTSAPSSVDIDNTAPVMLLGTANCLSTNGGTNARLDNGDTTQFIFSEALDPASLVASWTGVGTRPVSASVVDGTQDFMTYSVPLLGGSTYANAWRLGATTWTTGTFGASTLTRTDQDTYTITYGGYGGANIQRRATSGTLFTSSTPTDPAGNVATATSGLCGSTF